jgi:hypothetical protein
MIFQLVLGNVVGRMLSLLLPHVLHVVSIIQMRVVFCIFTLYTDVSDKRTDPTFSVTKLVQVDSKPESFHSPPEMEVVCLSQTSEQTKHMTCC